MKKVYTIKNAQTVEAFNNINMRTHSACAQGDESMMVSDGYHTFDELYEHRYKLFITLARLYDKLPAGKLKSTDMDGKVMSKVWRTKVHSGGTPSYDGYFLMGINYEKGEQISYHLPLRLWDKVDFAEVLDVAPEFDGHTSLNVLERIEKM